ncbi:hypothetical protein, variant [Aphanomyces astaci]|uniref:Protein unc-45 homolog B n=1 Tax=Aphanomyces astaci TaxID=112090 RepID=W4GLU7_APHAT|nr:hypothetical protein, variant [Aphanomyces astaci]ETV79878.1 hypothetical protein, variant [Aphanomyces astaci]|eukprot:XP_009830814.1 hypothetical protein, variant [Aphanomyces astaci]
MEQKKEDGKAFFTQGKWADALASYQAALAYPNVPVDMQSLLLSNIAMCQLKLRDFAGTLSSCDQAMSLPNVAASVMEKLLFRRAQAYMELDQLTPSARDIKAVLQLNPGNKPAALLLRQLQERARADASGVGKALKSLRDTPSLDALRFLEHASDTSIYRDVVAQHGESVLWKCVYACEDRSVGAAALRVLHKMSTASSGGYSSAAAVLAAVDLTILTTFVQPPQVALVNGNDDGADSLVFALEVGVIGLCGALVGYLAAQPTETSDRTLAPRRLLLDAVLNGLRSDRVPLQVAALDTLLTDLKQLHAKLRTSLDELGIFPLLLSRADVFEDRTVSRVALVFSQVLASFEGHEAQAEQIVRRHCVLPILSAPTMAAASPGAVLLCSVFLVNAKLGSSVIHSHPSFFQHLGDLLLASKSMLAYQELVMDLVAFVAGTETGAACIPLDLRVELGKIMQCDMDDKHLKLQATAVAALVKLHIVEKAFDPMTPSGHMMVDTVLGLLSRLHNATARPSVVGSTAAERSVEALSYIITFTPVKDLLVQHPRALAPLLTVSLTDTPSNMLYGVAYSLHHLLTSESHLKKQKMANSEMTPDQYEQLQQALKQKSELDDGDSVDQVHARLAAVLALPTAVKTLTLLLKTKSPAVLELAIQTALHATDSVDVRGKLVQGGVLAGLFPHAHQSDAAQQAIAKILITTNPHLIPSAQLLSAVRPLRTLCQNKHDAALLQFEALMALTNVASVSMETKARILADQGLGAIQYLQFSDHRLVRRAATECLTNLLPHDDVLRVFCQPDKARLWLAFSSIEESDEDFETARAAAGALATVTQYGEVQQPVIQCRFTVSRKNSWFCW